MKNINIIYKGPIFTLKQFEINVNGTSAKRDVLEHSPAVCMLTKVNDKFLFVKQNTRFLKIYHLLVDFFLLLPYNTIAVLGGELAMPCTCNSL